MDAFPAPELALHISPSVPPQNAGTYSLTGTNKNRQHGAMQCAQLLVSTEFGTVAHADPITRGFAGGAVDRGV